MPALITERGVLTDRTTQTYNCNIFHDTAYLRDTWGRYFEIVDILREAAGYQDAIVLRKPQ